MRVSKRIDLMKAIILSAGQGKRLFPLTRNLPKCLVEIGGRSILEWQLDVLCSCGIHDIVVVTGFQQEKVASLISKKYASSGVRTLYNQDYQKYDNLFSCWKASPEMKGDFVLLNGDTLFEPGVLKRLQAKASGPITLTVSTKERYDADDMKVEFDKGRLLRVGKDLPMKDVNGESIGLSLYREEGAEIFTDALSQAVREPGAAKRWYLSVIDSLAQRGLVSVVDVTGLAWCEIDFPRDLKSAEKVVSVIKKSLISEKYSHQGTAGRCDKRVAMRR